MFFNNKTSDWLSSKSKGKLENIFDIARKNKQLKSIKTEKKRS